MSIQLLDKDLEDRFFKSILFYEKLLKVIKSSIDKSMFTSPLKNSLWDCIISYLDLYKKQPTIDLLRLHIKSTVVNSELVITLLDNLVKIPLPDEEWIFKKIDVYIRTLKLRKSLYRGAELLKNNQLTQAENVILDTIRNGGLKKGTYTNDLDITASDVLEIARKSGEVCFPTRIYALDNIINGISRKELFVILAGFNVGKSWACIHMGLSALMEGRFVLYFTLEMSKGDVLKRFHQSVSGTYAPVSSSDKEKEVEVWDNDYTTKKTTVLNSLNDVSKVEEGLKKVRSLGGFLSIFEYAAGVCTISEIEQQINNFDAMKKKTPDLIIIDGLNDLKINRSNSDNYRLNLDSMVVELQRITHQYNCCVITTHQANRKGVEAATITSTHVSESIKVMQTCDTAISLSQDKIEQQLGELRINILKARNKRNYGEFKVYQNLTVGCFCEHSHIT